MAPGPGVPVRSGAAGALEGSGVPVAGAGLAGARQSRGGRHRGLSQTGSCGQQCHGADGLADRGAVLRTVPAGGRLSGSEAGAVVGGVPGVDEEAGAADLVGAAGGAEFATVVTVSVGGAGSGRLVAAAAVEQAEESAEHCGRGAAAAWAGDGIGPTRARVAG